MQREMAVLGEPRKIKDVPMELLNMCDDELDSVRLCIQMSGYTHEYICKHLSMDKGHFSRVMSGSVGFPTHKRLNLMRLCGNRAPLQYEVMHVGLGDDKREAPADVKAENEVLKAQNAAIQAKLEAVQAALAAMLTPATTLQRAA